MAGGQDNIIGIAMDLDVTSLKAGLQETKKAITTANKEFAAATAGMDDWRKSSEGLTAKLAQLDTKILNQKKNVAGYEAQMEKLRKEGKENTEEFRKLNDQYLDQVAALKKSEKEQRKYTAMLQKVESETQDVTSGTKQMSRAMKDADRSTVDLKGGFTVLKGAIAGLVTQGITALVGGLKNAVEESREFRKELAYLSETATSTGSDFDDVKDQLRDVTAITDDQGAAIEGLNNLMSAGFKSDALDQITDQLVGASIKWKDTLKFEGLADGLQETLATGSAVGPFVELLERAGLVAEDFDAGLQACTTDAEKQNYVLNTLSKLGLSEIKKGYEENNKTLIEANKASFDYAEAQAQLGEKVEPVLTTVKQGFTDILKSFLEMYAGTDLTGLQTSIRDAFQWFIETCVPTIKKAIDFFMEHWQPIVVAIGAIGGAFLAWKAVEIVSDVTKAVKELDLSLIKSIASFAKDTAGKIANTVATTAQTVATKGATTAQKLLNLAMKANPILLIVSLIAMLVTAFITLWNTSEEFREFWIGLWEKIKAVAKVVVDWLVKAFTNTWNAIKKVWSVAVSFFTGIWSGITNAFSSVVSFFTGIFSNAWNGIKNAFGNVASFFSGIVSQIVGFFSGIPGKLVQIGQNMISGLISGVKSYAGRLKDAVVDTVMAPVNWVKDKLGIHSPSTLMRDEIGKMMGEGVGVGLLASTKDVIKDANRFAKSVTAGLTADVGKINAGLSASVPKVNGASSNTTITNNYTQTINAPKQPSRLELYRQTKNLLSYKGAY